MSVVPRPAWASRFGSQARTATARRPPHGPPRRRPARKETPLSHRARGGVKADPPRRGLAAAAATATIAVFSRLKRSATLRPAEETSAMIFRWALPPCLVVLISTVAVAEDALTPGPF